MILSKKNIEHFQSLSSLVIKAMKEKNAKYPYETPNNLFLETYESLRLVWVDNVPIKKACAQFKLDRNAYYIRKKILLSMELADYFLFLLSQNSLII